MTKRTINYQISYLMGFATFPTLVLVDFLNPFLMLQNITQLTMCNHHFLLNKFPVGLGFMKAVSKSVSYLTLPSMQKENRYSFILSVPISLSIHCYKQLKTHTDCKNKIKSLFVQERLPRSPSALTQKKEKLLAS